MNKVENLIISNTLDFSTDLVCCEFENRNLSYFRLNRDQLSQYKIEYSLSDSTLSIVFNEQEFCINSDYLVSVYFRAPVFLRNTNKQYSLDEQVSRSQWSSFIRNLIVFDSARWVNHPVATYRAENKLYQLEIAKKCGFNIPLTRITNSVPHGIQNDSYYIVKSLDTALFYEDGQEMFTYSTKISGKELFESELRIAPVIIQEFLKDKIDIRVTVVGNSMFAVSITKNGHPIDGDWRKANKDNLDYKPMELPMIVQDQTRKLMSKLNLGFGGMDLAVVDGMYYFIEVNPTGEWGWLSTNAKLPIEKAIVEHLSNKG